MAVLTISAFTATTSAANVSTLTVGGKSAEDWEVFESLTSTQSKSAASILSNYSVVGGTDTFNGGATQGTVISWTSDGTPTASGSNSAGIRNNSFNAADSRGFSFTATVGTGERTVRVWLGRYSDNAPADLFKITASISDVSTATQTSQLAGIASDTDGYYDITVAAGSAAQTLTVTWQSNTAATNYLRAVNLRAVWISTETAGGGTYSATITEPASAAESTSALMSGVASRTEAAAAVDSSNATFVTGLSIAESVTSSESINAAIVSLGSVSESVTAIEVSSSTVTAGGIYSVAIVETAIASHTNTSLMVASGLISESASASDALNSALICIGSQLEIATAVELLSAAITQNATVTEAATASESSNSILTQVYNVAITEIVSAIEYVQASIIQKLMKRLIGGAVDERTATGNLVKRNVNSNLTERNV